MTDCTAIATLRVRIRTRASDPRLVLVPGLADDLRLIGEAFHSLQQAVQLLARAELARTGNYPLSKVDYHDLVVLAGEDPH
jgi:hypothetical protein